MIYASDVREQIENAVGKIFEDFCEKEDLNGIYIDKRLSARYDDAIDSLASIIAAVVSYNTNKKGV